MRGHLIIGTCHRDHRDGLGHMINTFASLVVCVDYLRSLHGPKLCRYGSTGPNCQLSLRFPSGNQQNHQ